MVNAGRVASNAPTGLEENIAARLAELVPTGGRSACVERCLGELRALVRRLGPDWDALPFGSFANGFSTEVSDLDVTCFCAGASLRLETQQKAAQTLAQQILPMLRQHRSFAVEDEIFGARVPIVKLRFEGCLEVDLSCHNPVPLLNTRLLASYSRMDGRVRDLGLAVKVWAKGAGICDATKSNLSSYSFTLLVLYFMQVHPDVRLPLLPPDAFEDGGKCENDIRVAGAMASWRCELSTSLLLKGFFRFFSNDFRWGSEVVSVRCGSRHTATQPMFDKLRGHRVSRLHIEDPYQVERNLHCTLGDDEELQLRAALAEASAAVSRGETPAALRPRHAYGQRCTRAPDTRAPVAGPERHEHYVDLIRAKKMLSGDPGADSSDASTRSNGPSPTTGSDTEQGAEHAELGAESGCECEALIGAPASGGSPRHHGVPESHHYAAGDGVASTEQRNSLRLSELVRTIGQQSGHVFEAAGPWPATFKDRAVDVQTLERILSARTQQPEGHTTGSTAQSRATQPPRPAPR